MPLAPLTLLAPGPRRTRRDRRRPGQPGRTISIGSAIQFGLVVTPLLVLASWAMGRPVTLVFSSPLGLFAIAGAVFIVNAITGEGETTWFQGVLLLGVHALPGLAFFFVG